MMVSTSPHSKMSIPALSSLLLMSRSQAQQIPPDILVYNASLHMRLEEDFLRQGRGRDDRERKRETDSYTLGLL